MPEFSLEYIVGVEFVLLRLEVEVGLEPPGRGLQLGLQVAPRLDNLTLGQTEDKSTILWRRMYSIFCGNLQQWSS